MNILYQKEIVLSCQNYVLQKQCFGMSLFFFLSILAFFYSLFNCFMSCTKVLTFWLRLTSISRFPKELLKLITDFCKYQIVIYDVFDKDTVILTTNKHSQTIESIKNLKLKEDDWNFHTTNDDTYYSIISSKPFDLNSVAASKLQFKAYPKEVYIGFVTKFDKESIRGEIPMYNSWGGIGYAWWIDGHLLCKLCNKFYYQIDSVSGVNFSKFGYKKKDTIFEMKLENGIFKWFQNEELMFSKNIEKEIKNDFSNNKNVTIEQIKIKDLKYYFVIGYFDKWRVAKINVIL